MKKKMLAITGMIAAAGLIALIVKKMRAKEDVIPQRPLPKPRHHRTDVFAKAKERVSH